MDYKANITLTTNPGKLKAFASISINDEFVVKDIKVITTDNAMKWIKFPVSYEEWCKAVNNCNNNFGIVKTAHESKLGNYQRMSYQMVNSLSLKGMKSVMKDSKDPVTVKSGGVVKSFNDAYINVKGDQQANVVSSRTEKVSSSCKYAGFEMDSSISYVASGKYILTEATGETLFNSLSATFNTDGGCMDNEKISSGVVITPPTSTQPTSAPTTVPTTVPTTTPVTPSTGLAGDANCDGKVTIADAAAIFQYMSNSDKYTLSKQGMANADVSNKGDGITAADAIAIQKFDAGLLSKLPESVQ